MTDDNKQYRDELKKEYAARLAELESQLAYINMLIKNTEQDIIENEAEKELLLKALKRIRYEERNESDIYNGKDVTERWKKITRKMTDANTFHWALFRSNNESTVLTTELKNEITKILTELTRSYNNLSKINKEYESLLESFDKEEDSGKKAKIKTLLEEKSEEFNEIESVFNNLYLELINKQQTRNLYDAYAQNDVEKKLEELNIENIEPLKLANSRENVDRVKFMIYLDDYVRAYKEGRDIPAPKFSRLEKYYNKKTGEVKNEDFPAFFQELMGVSFEAYEQENEIKNDKARQILTKHHIKALSDKEKLALKYELTEEDLAKEEEKKPILSYLSITEKDEEKDDSRLGKLKRGAKRIKTDIDYGTDPYLTRNPLYQKRAKEVHDAIHGRMLEQGNIIGGLLDLNKLTDVESLRPDLTEIVKDYVKSKTSEAKTGAKRKVKEVIDKKMLGKGIGPKGLRITTSILDKANYLKRKKKKANSLGKTLTNYLIRKFFEGIVEKVTDTAKSALNFVKNTTQMSRLSNYIRSTSFGQSLQKMGTATIDTTKSIAKMPGDFVSGLLDKGDLAIKAIKANRFVIAAMDAGHIGKTFLGKAPTGLLYGVGSTTIALSLGLPVGALAPFAIGAGLVGMGIDTVDDLMNTPTFRPPGKILGWFQSRGSAYLKNPITGGFSNEIVQNNPAAATQLAKVGNANGGIGARLFNAANTGLKGALLAATIASLIGVNPFVAGAVAFGSITATKFALKTATGKAAAEALKNGAYGKIISRLGIIPLQRMMYMISGTQIMANMIQDVVNYMKQGRGIGDYYSDKLSFKNKGGIERLLIATNYLNMYGYFSNYAFLSRLLVGRMLEYLMKGGEISGIFGPSKYTGIMSMLKSGWAGLRSTTSLSQLFLKLGVGLRAAFLPTLLIAGSSLLGIGIASLLGVSVGGIGATIGGLVGGLVGMGIGALIIAASGGTLAPFITPIILVANTIGTALGTWIGSLFDKTVDGIVKNMFAVISGISFLFTLISLFNGKSMNLNKIAMTSLSLALTLPALGAVIDRASVQQSESNSTIPTPTIVQAYYNQNNPNSSIQVINNSGYPIQTKEINKITNQIFSQTPQYVELKKYVILKKDGDSNIYVNDNSLIINLSVIEQNPEKIINQLIASLSSNNTQKTSSLQ